MAPADCVQKSASIIQLTFFIIHEGERSAGRAAAAAAAAVKEQTAVFGQSLLFNVSAQYAFNPQQSSSELNSA